MEYEPVKISNQQDMLHNFKQQLEKHNNNISLSDTEFTTILNYLSTGTIFERAKKLRDRFALKRDKTTEPKYLQFLNISDWCKNEFQVAHQIRNQGKRSNRYDVTILINGLPLVQIELKRRGAELKTAFHQIKRYGHESYDAGKGLFQYVQIFIISNGVNTKYFSNAKEHAFEQTFFWTDKDNKTLTDLHAFTAEFLKQCHIAKMISHYTVLNETRETLMVLRPYQFYAVEAITERVKNSVQNAYIWHTTGSGKTLTSFKASQIIRDQPSVHKVLFVVDRKDLDYQTIREFNAFSKGCVDITTDTHDLITQLNDSSKKLIVTTIQKLNNAIQNPRYSEKINELQDKKVVFIFDECHRSQFGETHQNIKRFFKQAQMFGFTGTPIFADNAAGSGEHQQTTKSLFGECLHKYVIIDAIRDENVLRFSVEYVGRYKRKASENEIDIDVDVEAIDTKEALEAESRLEKIVDYILEHHAQKTKAPNFTAMFCVSNIQTLIKYYDLFKRKQADATHKLKIATIFSYAANPEENSSNGLLAEESPDLPTGIAVNQTHRDKLDEFIADYNTLFNTQFSTESSRFAGYYGDISKQVKLGKVDILLVVNMFLTGFDSPRLNTLYVDKNLKFHGLIQAFSRTNRILNEKKSQGNIVCFRNLKQETDEAIALFSNKNAKEEVLLRPYEEYLTEFNQASTLLLNSVPNLESIDNLPDENAQLEFVTQFRNLLRLKNVLTSFADFTPDDLKLSSQDFENYKSKYLDLYDRVKHKDDSEKTSILNDVDFEVCLIRRDDINVAYILSLLQDLNELTPEDSEKRRKEIMELVSGDVQLRSKRALIEAFIEANALHPHDNLSTNFEHFWATQSKLAFDKLCTEEKLIPEKLWDLLKNYNSKRKELLRNQQIIDALVFAPKMLERTPIATRVRQKIEQFVDIFIDNMAGTV
jgi:type I restriction enzyme R subunit